MLAKGNAAAEKNTLPGLDTQAGKAVVKNKRGSILGAIFLMATSAIGPGFITQTATFTFQFGAAFGFAILISILIDIAVQMNIWRIIVVSGKRAGELANAALPGSGFVLAVLIIGGGLVFNIGNIAGGGMGMNSMFGIDVKLGGLITALFAIGIFLWKRAGKIMDSVIILLGVVMICLMFYVAVVSQPPVGEALRQTVLPDTINWATITTIVGGTVGGYITYSGAHRFLDSGHSGPAAVKDVTNGSINGVVVTGVMRYLLFLACFGVGASVLAKDASVVIMDLIPEEMNPAGWAFLQVMGDAGLRIFGMILWAASISSVIGAAFTSVSFFSVFNKKFAHGWPRNIATVVFIAVSLVCFLVWGQAPGTMLVFAGGLNGLILPIGLTIFMYIGWFRARDLLQGYRYPKWLLVAGTAATALSWYMAVVSVRPIFEMIQG
ncbi:NRAMP family divalent metal transporter [Actinobaculum suis]|uniref:NRAMP family divalent metal transporter n=1 Tax=Actinobaculum suis TaxID=1657 RepID=UPI000808673A|nr:NRAMP family divalent metal transporter [Actinobaculum suis]OCA93386.1 hypothetical protein ACU20_00780 [Actinobaculum suis]OCA94307.1 hypothetical protein ACU21_00830 [Actinobaculum suis]